MTPGRSRLLGAIVGGIGGAAIGFGATFYLYGSDMREPNLGLLPRILAGLAVGALGALLGSLSGLSKD
jgi:hypothetical protein